MSAGGGSGRGREGGRVRVEFAPLHAGQLDVVRHARRYNVIACGRRWGKTTLAESRVAETALYDGQPAGWFAPGYKQLADSWRRLVDDLAPVTRPGGKSEQDHRLELLTGGTLECWSLDNPDAARGRGYRRVVIDEAAHVGELDHAWQAVIRPTLVDYAGDAWFVSTPNGLNGFWRLFQRGRDPAESHWAAWQRPTGENPFIDPAEVAAARSELPERVFAQEHLAAFLETAGAVFRRVQEAATAEPQRGAVAGHAYAIGVDWGKLADYTVFAVLDLTTHELVALDRSNQVDYRLQVERLAALCGRFPGAALIVERNAMGDPLIEQLRAVGLRVWPWTATNTTKGAAIEAVAVALEQGRLRLLRDAVLLGELLAYTAERLPSGALRYSAPEGQHDDTVMALAMAWQAAAHPVDPASRQTYTVASGAARPEVERAQPSADSPASRSLWAELAGHSLQTTGPDPRTGRTKHGGSFRW